MRRISAIFVVAGLCSCSGESLEDASPDESIDTAEAALIAQNWIAPFEATVRSSLTSSEGSLSSANVDWAHWGKSSATSVNGNAAVAIQNFKKIGSATVGWIPTGPLAFSWNNGSPTASASDVRGHIRICGAGNGFSFEVPARQRGRKVRLFAGAHNASANVTAWFGSSGIVPSRTLANAAGSQFGYYDIAFSSATDNTPLRIELTVGQAGSTPPGANSCVSLLAATLSNIPNTSGSVALTVNEPNGFLHEETFAFVQVAASHADNVRGVELYYDNVLVPPVDLSPPYEFWVPLKAGRGQFHAEVTTMLGTTFKSGATPINSFYVLNNFGEQAIPDAGGWVESELHPNTPTTGVVKEAIVALGIRHPYVGDLEFAIESPSGRTIVLSNEKGGGGDDFWSTTFRDGGTPLSQGNAPFQGTYAPEQPLSGFIGESFAGSRPWRFKVRDKYASDVGTVQYRKLFLRVEP